MTMEERADRDQLDDAVDHALKQLTAVDRFEAASRLRTHARLRESVEVDESSARGPFRTSGWLTWVAAPAAIAMLVVLGLSWPTLFPTRPGVERPAGSTQAARAARPEPPHAAGERPGEPVAPRAHAAPETSVTERPRATPSWRRAAGGRRSPAGLNPRPASTGTNGDPDRLAAFLRAVQQLPPDVWERVDKAGPPVVSTLNVEEAAPIAPITIDELAAPEVSRQTEEPGRSETPTAPSPFTLPGGPR
jgi:hypothetical protein